MNPKHFIMGVKYGDNIAQMGDVIEPDKEQAEMAFYDDLTVLSSECKNPNCVFCIHNNLVFPRGSE